MIFKAILKSILPPRCLKCGKILESYDDGLCPDCFNEINFISRPYCEKCGHPLAEAPSNKVLYCPQCLQNHKSPFRYSRSAFQYDEASKNLILSFKFFDKTENAKFLGRLLFVAGKDLWQNEADVLVPIPLHYTRLIKRRYNQSALLCREVSKLCHLPVDYNSVIRHKKTRPQVEFSGFARISNVKNAFYVKCPEKVKDKRVVLVDDVMTTGSTLKECALALRKAGVKSVDTLTVARVC